MEYWSGFLEWNIGGKFWSGTENSILVVNFVSGVNDATTKCITNG